jgi:ppGpp synthetase/RelA/SpoT-type nucleotidyltranferase
VDALRFDEIEYSLRPFRVGRRLIFDRILASLSSSNEVQAPALLLSRLFVRLKSADSILEKIKRKQLPVQSAADIPTLLDDILGFRLIAENQSELLFLDRFLTSTFTVKSVLRQTPNQQFGEQSINYSLVYEQGGQSFPFEVQLRTFLQHYWSGHSFFLFHKSDSEAARLHRDDLLAFSDALRTAENLAEKIQNKKPGNPDASAAVHWQKWKIRNRVHLMIIEPLEQFVEHQVVPLSGNDEEDHHAIVAAKIAGYAEHPGAAIVECLCANFTAYLLNEPQVNVSPEFLEKAIW